MQKLIRNYIVFTSGFVIISFEILGSRILAPIVGTTAHVWGGLLAIIIAGSSLGYWIGGEASDTPIESSQYTFWVGIIAAIWILLIVPGKSTFVSIHLTSRYGTVSLLLSTILFLVPTLLLSSITTFITRRTMRDAKSAGVTAGSLYAVTTLGSVLSIFSMGYILIPTFPVSRIVYIIASLTLLGALCSRYLKTYERLQAN